MKDFVIKFIKGQFTNPIRLITFVLPSLYLIINFMNYFGKVNGLILGLLNVVILDICAALMAYYVENK